jgi:hypothetical protein
MLQIQNQQDVIDECGRATQLIQTLLSKCNAAEPPGRDDTYMAEAHTVLDSDSALDGNLAHTTMDRDLLQQRLNSVDTCSAQAAATMKVLEASLSDRKAALHSLQVSFDSAEHACQHVVWIGLPRMMMACLGYVDQ